MVKKPTTKRRRSALPKSQVAVVVRSTEAQAAGHRRTRDARSSESAQDYVEVVADLIEECGEARTVDIAKRLGVTPVTVTKTVKRLQREGLLTSEPYRAIFLTETGSRIARESRRRHRIVVDFLLALGVSPHTAWVDSEGIEHHVSQETLSAFEALSRRIKTPANRKSRAKRRAPA